MLEEEEKSDFRYIYQEKGEESNDTRYSCLVSIHCSDFSM